MPLGPERNAQIGREWRGTSCAACREVDMSLTRRARRADVSMTSQLCLSDQTTARRCAQQLLGPGINARSLDEDALVLAEIANGIPGLNMVRSDGWGVCRRAFGESFSNCLIRGWRSAGVSGDENSRLCQIQRFSVDVPVRVSTRHAAVALPSRCDVGTTRVRSAPMTPDTADPGLPDYPMTTMLKTNTCVGEDTRSSPTGNHFRNYCSWTCAEREGSRRSASTLLEWIVRLFQQGRGIRTHSPSDGVTKQLARTGRPLTSGCALSGLLPGSRTG
jgi:hypothetical protein